MNCPGFCRQARWWNRALVLLAFFVSFRPFLSAGGANVLTYHNDNARTGQYLSETNLTPATVNANTFGLLFAQPVDGQIYAQPLYVAGITISNRGVHNVVIVATENDSVYAFDADSNAAPLWQDSFINPAAGITAVPSSDVNSAAIAPVIGITSTPVIDPATLTLYVEVKTKEVTSSSTNWVHRLHALDLGSGAEKFGGPVVISPVVNGAGAGNDGLGHVPFNGLRQLNRPALLLENGVVYIAFASQGDNPPYHGWLVGFNAQTLQAQSVYNATPNGSEGGFWESGDGPAADTNGTIYLATGNGTFDAATNDDFGDSFLKIAVNGTNLNLSDYFTPYNEQTLDASDLDVGSGGLIIVPDNAGSPAIPHLLVGGGKQGILYVVNRDNLGHFNPSNNNQIIQSLGGFSGLYMTPAYYNGTLYVIGTGGPLEAFACDNGALGTSPSSTGPEAYGFPGATPSISANGASNGIVWAIQNSSPAILRAYNATNAGQEIYNSQQAGARDQLGAGVKFVAPTIANGKVYVGGAASLAVFGPGLWAVAPSLSPNGGFFTNSVTVMLSDSASGSLVYYTLDGTIPTTNSTLYTGPFTLTNATPVEAFAVISNANSSAVTSALFLPVSPQTAIAGFGGNGSGWTLNGGAAVRYNAVTLTDGNGNEARSAFFNQRVYVGAFNAQFVYQTTPGADGAAFVIQNSANGPSALGGYGGCLGYCGIAPSAAVELDLYGGDGGPGTVYNTDGTTGSYASTSPLNLDSGDPIWAHINYDGSQLTEALLDLTTGATFSTNYSVDIPAVVGDTNQAYVGFTAGDGGVLSVQTVSDFVYTLINPPTQPPEISPDGAIFSNAIVVTLASPLSDAQIFYTLNGALPSTNSSLYSSPLFLTNTTALSAITVAPDASASPIALAFFGEASAGTSISGFGSSGWTLNGGATMANSVVTLTDGNGGEARSAFYATPQEITNFVVRFVYQSGGGADGAAFVMQNSSEGTAALGTYGGCLGYCGIAPSGAVEFNLYSGNGGTGTRFATNGVTAGYASTLPLNLGSGDPIWVTLTYDGSVLTEALVDQDTGNNYVAAYTVNLSSVVGANTALVGFTGGDGGVASIQTVANFTFAPYLAPPVLAAGIAGNQLVFSWQTNLLNYVLQYTTNLLPQAVWQPVPQTPVISGGQAAVTIPMGSTNSFYRLAAP